MNQNSKSPTPFKFPIWAQALTGIVLLALVFWAGISSTSYLSAWDEEDSNFFDSATQALKMSGIHPTAPTAFIFWENECEPCKPTIEAFQNAPARLRIFGIHLAENSSDEIKIRQMWHKIAPKASQLKIDRDEILQTSFQVRAVPETFIYLPKQKKFFSFLGDVTKTKERMQEIVDSEY